MNLEIRKKAWDRGPGHFHIQRLSRRELPQKTHKQESEREQENWREGGVRNTTRGDVIQGESGGQVMSNAALQDKLT